MIALPFLSRLTGSIVLLLAAGTLAACSVEVDEGPGGYNPRPPQFCTREYAPVCGERGRDRQTFANACEARSSGYGIIGRGECQFRRPDRDQTGWQDEDRDGWNNDGRDRDRDRNRNDRDRRERERDRNDRGDRERPRDQRACTMDYNPVCGRRGPDFKEFGNACSAEAAGFTVYRRGQCPIG